MLRGKLKELGFGMFQESVYISPHDFTKDLVEFLHASELSGFVYVFEIFHDQMAIGNVKELAQKVWRLDTLNEHYLKLIEKIRHLISSHGREVKLNDTRDRKEEKVGEKVREKGEKVEVEKVGKEKIGEIIREIKEEYLGLIFIDPFLPKELLPVNWASEELTGLIKKL